MHVISRVLLPFLLLAYASNSVAATGVSSLTCKKEAINESKRLLSYFRDNDDRIEIDGDVKPLSKMQNPANKSQYFDVLETWGYIYKGRYRMRITLFKDCTILGEEVLEFANL